MPPDEGRPQPPDSGTDVPAPRAHESAGEAPPSHCAVCGDPFEEPEPEIGNVNSIKSVTFRIITVSGNPVCSRTCELAENERLKEVQRATQQEGSGD